MINMTTKYMHALNLMFSCMEVDIFLLWCVLCHAYVVLFQLIYPSSDNGIGILCCSRGEIIQTFASIIRLIYVCFVLF